MLSTIEFHPQVTPKTHKSKHMRYVSVIFIHNIHTMYIGCLMYYDEHSQMPSTTASPFLIHETKLMENFIRGTASGNIQFVQQLTNPRTLGSVLESSFNLPGFSKLISNNIHLHWKTSCQQMLHIKCPSTKGRTKFHKICMGT